MTPSDLKKLTDQELAELDKLLSSDYVYQKDPVGWIQTRLGEFLWSKQIEIANAIVNHRHVGVESCNGIGKSFIASRIMAWWGSCFPLEDSIVVSTATTFKQVKNILWREFRRAHKKSKLQGRTNLTEWKINGELVGFGLKPDDHDPAAFQGIHALRVLVVIDEGDGVPEDIFTAAESLITNEESRMFVIGNPDLVASPFERRCRPDSGWKVIRISWFDSPNATGEYVPERLSKLLTSKIWQQERLKEFGGEDDPRYQSKVLGQRPRDVANGVVPMSGIRECMELPDDSGPQHPVEVGFDVGAGGDEAVLRERRGVHVGRRAGYRTEDSDELVGHAVRFICLTGATAIKVDVIGVGWGIVGSLKAICRDAATRVEQIDADDYDGEVPENIDDLRTLAACKVYGINVGEASREPHKFPKLRDELWWMARELTESKAWNLKGLDDVTVFQLASPTWAPDAANRVHVEAKRDTKKRLKRSPDDADALILAYCQPKSVKFIWA